MKKRTVFVMVIVGILVFLVELGFGVLAPPFDTPPYDTDLTGNSAGRNSGGSFLNPERGYTNLIYWIGTNGTPGSLLLYFDDPFIDGQGNDFAIRTSGEGWGYLADQAEFKFYMEDTFVGSFRAILWPNAIFEFDLPGKGMVANQIVITNITTDPPGINNDATMAFVDAGVVGVPVVRNTVPVACVVGGDQIVEAGSDCEARVVLDGSCSSDEDSTPGTNDDINDFSWYQIIDPCDPNSDILLGSGEVIECNLPAGEHTILLEVTDTVGAFDSNEITITVEDNTPPVFSLTVQPNVLWPVNHKMIEITPLWEVRDNCDDDVDVSLVDITIEDVGNTEDDVFVDPNDGSIRLRAERSGKGSRVYTITYQAVDDSNNVATASAEVIVPHDGRRKSEDR